MILEYVFYINLLLLRTPVAVGNILKPFNSLQKIHQPTLLEIQLTTWNYLVAIVDRKKNQQNQYRFQQLLYIYLPIQNSENISPKRSSELMGLNISPRT